jgi:hypothetical protein
VGAPHLTKRQLCGLKFLVFEDRGKKIRRKKLSYRNEVLNKKIVMNRKMN